MAPYSWSVLLLVVLSVPLTWALDIKWYKWLDGTHLPSSLNLSTCGSCYEQILKTVDDIYQDIVYANKTINIERISSKISSRLDDIEGAYDEHSIGHRQANDSLTHSLYAFVALHGKFSNNSDPGAGTHKIIDILEEKSNISEQLIKQDEHPFEQTKLKAQRLRSRVESLLYIHYHQMGNISSAKGPFAQSINSGYQMINPAHKLSPYSDLMEHSARQLEFLISKSNQTISAQVKDGIQIDTIYSGYVKRLHHLTGMSQEFQVYRMRHLDKALLEKIFGLSHLKHSDYMQLKDNLTRLLADLQIKLNVTRETRSRLLDLRQSISSNDERESDERLVLSDSQKYIKTLYGKLEKLTQRFKNSTGQVAKPKTYLDRLELLDILAVTTVKNLTTELAHKNTNISNWHATDLVSRQEELSLSYDSIIRVFSSQTQQNLAEWNDILELVRRIENIVKRIHTINSTIASINKTMNFHSFFNNSSKEERLPWGSKDLMGILNDSKSIKSKVLPTLEGHVLQLRQLVHLATSDLDQARAYLSETQDILRNLNSARLSNQNTHTGGQGIYDGLALAINESSLTNDYLATNLTTRAEELTGRISREAFRAGFGSFDDYLRAQYSVGANLNLTLELRVLSENYEELKSRVTDGSSAKRVAPQTTPDRRDMRGSITSLRNKVIHARTMLNKLKLGRTHSTDSNERRNLGLKLWLPPTMNDQPPSYTSISFLIKIARNDTNEIALRVEPPIMDGNASCYMSRRHILVKIMRGHLVLGIKLGKGAKSESMYDEVPLSVGTVHRVVITKIGPTLDILVQSNNSSRSLKQTLEGPYTTLKIHANDTSVRVGGLPRDDACDRDTESLTAMQLSRFSGQLDELEVNGHKLGLWNTESKEEEEGRNDYNNNHAGGRPDMHGDDFRGEAGGVKLAGRMASFSRPKSNISSSFIQVLHGNRELEMLLTQNESSSATSQADELIREFTVSFKTSQPNALLLHHARPDHSSFLSIYISGGRLMLAFNFDKKIRYESHFSLSDGEWHHLSLVLSHDIDSSGSSSSSSIDGGNKVSFNTTSQQQQQIGHRVTVIIDDEHLYREDYTLNITSGSANRPRLARQPRLDLLELVTSNLDETPPADGSLVTVVDDDKQLQRKLLYFGGLEDKYSPLLRSQCIPTNFHGCVADVTINRIFVNLESTHRSSGISLDQCNQLD